MNVPWPRKGSGFALLFEQTALTLVREMPVNAAARFMSVTDKRLWRVVQHYVSQALSKLVCDMSPAFLSAVESEFTEANVTVDWFHVVQLFTRAVDQVRKEERRHYEMPKALRWAVLKKADGPMAAKQEAVLIELDQYDFDTARALAS